MLCKFLYSCFFGYFCVDIDYLDSVGKKIVMIYVVIVKFDLIKECWVGIKIRKK